LSQTVFWKLSPKRKFSQVTPAETAAPLAVFTVFYAEKRIRLDPTWGLSIEAIPAKFSSLKILSSLSSFNHPQVTTSV